MSDNVKTCPEDYTKEELYTENMELQERVAELEEELQALWEWKRNCQCGHEESRHDWETKCGSYPACDCEHFVSAGYHQEESQ